MNKSAPTQPFLFDLPPAVVAVELTPHESILALSKADRRLHREITKYRQGALGKDSPVGRCFVLAHGLLGYLGYFHDLEVELQEVDFKNEATGLWTNHCILKRGDGTIIDPTADQFHAHGSTLPAVYIGPMPQLYKDWIEAAVE